MNTNEDSEEYRDFTPAQIDWMKKDVAAARKAGSEWIIVNMHKGPYITSNHATDEVSWERTGFGTKSPLLFPTWAKRKYNSGRRRASRSFRNFAIAYPRSWRSFVSVGESGSGV
ncbi:hypothetical protein ABND49_18715 [Paenibacillus larvae]|uniref:Uncharacterized protein n=1 Tax=Paenibacillus larvae TaxID=1464 RepID=A0AAP5JU29_9BACL|nr:hypothetical protein [Paenibacillus larvae]MDT2251944.1 hypothetical protein [Paenibacillus larvae]MDV3486836.1 hypothetical protein [Paenibacillus larvae]